MSEIVSGGGVSVPVSLDLGQAKQQLGELRTAFEDLNESFKDAPNVTNAFNQGMMRALDLVDMLDEKIDNAKNLDDDRLKGDVNSGIQELNALKALYTSGGEFNGDRFVKTFGQLSTQVQAELDKSVGAIANAIRTGIRTVKSTTVTGITKELMDSSEMEAIFSGFKHTDFKTFKGFVENLVPRIAPTYNLDPYKQVRYGTTNVGSRDMLPKNFFPSTFASSYANKAYQNAFAGQTGIMQKDQRDYIRNIISKNDAALRAAEATAGMTTYGKDGRVALSRNITPEMFDTFRRNLFDDLVVRMTGMPSNKIDPFNPQDKNEARKLVSRMTSSSAGRTLSAMRDIDSLLAVEGLWGGTAADNVFETLKTVPRRTLEQYEIAKYNIEGLLSKANPERVAITESQNTRLLGLQGKHNQFTDKVVEVSLAEYDKENKEQSKLLDKLLSGRAVSLPGTDKKYIAQNIHGTGLDTVVRMVEAEAYKAVDAEERKWAKENGFVDEKGRGLSIWNDFIPKNYDFGDIKSLRKHYDALGKGWSPGYKIHANWKDENNEDKMFGVVDLSKVKDEKVAQKLADGLAWFADGIFPVDDFQGRGPIATKGTFHSLKGYKTLGEWANAVGLANKDGRFVLPGPRGDVDLTDFVGMTDISEIKSTQALDNFKDVDSYNKAYTKLMQHYGMEVMASYEDAETRAKGIGAQAMAFMNLSPRMQKLQGQEFARRMRLLDTEAGIKEYILGDPDNFLGEELRSGRITAAHPAVRSWAESERQALISRISAGEWIDFGTTPSVVNQMINKSPLASLLGVLNLDNDKGLNQSIQEKYGSRDDLLKAIRGAYETKSGKKLNLTDEELSGVFALDKGQIVDFAQTKNQIGHYMDREGNVITAEEYDKLTDPQAMRNFLPLVSAIRSPSSFGGFVSGRNYAGLAKDIYDTLGISKDGVYFSEADMLTMGDADFDGDRLKTFYGDIALEIKRSQDEAEEMIKMLNGAYDKPEVKNVELEGATDFKNSPTHEKLYAEAATQQGRVMGATSEGGTRAAMWDLRNPQNRDMIAAAVQSNQAYAEATAALKGAKDVEITEDMRKALYAGYAWSKLPTRYSGLFSIQDSDKGMDTESDDIAHIHQGKTTTDVNLKALRDLNFDRINFRSIYSAKDRGSLLSLASILPVGTDTTRAEALLEALDKNIGYGEGEMAAGEKAKALMQLTRRMKVYDMFSPKRILNDDELRNFEEMTLAAEQEILDEGTRLHEEKGMSTADVRSFTARKMNELGVTSAKNFISRGIHEKNIRNIFGREGEIAFSSFYNDALGSWNIPEAKVPERMQSVEDARKNLEAQEKAIAKNDKEIEKKEQELARYIIADEKDIVADAERERLDAEIDKEKQRQKLDKEIKDEKNLEKRTKLMDERANLGESGSSLEDLVAKRQALGPSINEMITQLSAEIDTLKAKRDPYEARRDAAQVAFDEASSRLAAQTQYEMLMGNIGQFRNGLFISSIRKEHELAETPKAEIYYANNRHQAEKLEKEYNKFKETEDYKQLSANEKFSLSMQFGNGGISDLVERDFADTTEVKAKRLSEKYEKINRRKGTIDEAIAQRFEGYDKDLEEVQGYIDRAVKNSKREDLTSDQRRQYDKSIKNARADYELAEEEVYRRKEEDITSILDKYQHQFENPFEKIQRGADEATQQVSSLVEMLKVVYKEQGLSDEEVAKKLEPYEKLPAKIKERAEARARTTEYEQETRYNQLMRQGESFRRNPYGMRRDIMSRAMTARDSALSALESRRAGLSKQIEIETNPAKLKALQTAINQTNQDIEMMSSGWGLAGSAMAQFGQSVDRVVQRLGRRLFMKVLQETKRFVQEFNSQMTTIQMITLKTDQQMATLGDGLIAKAQELKVSISEIASSAETLYRQGLSDEEVNERLEVISKFSKVSGTKIDAATKLVTVAMNTGLVSNPEIAADIVTALGDNAATNAAEIEKGIEKAGAAAAADGTTFAELASMLTAITSTTQIGGNVAGRTLNTIFGRMNKIGTNELIYDENGYAVSGSAVSKLLKSVGVDTYVNGKKRSSYDVLYDLSQKWEELTDAQQQQLANQIAGTRQYSNFSAIMQGMAEGKVSEYMSLTEGSGGIVDQKYDIYTESLAAAITDVRNAWDALVHDLTDTGALTGLLKWITNMINGFNNMASSVGGLNGLIAAAIPLLTAFAMIKIGSTMGIAGLPVLAAGLGLAAAGAFIYNQAGADSEKSSTKAYKENNEAYDKKANETSSYVSRLTSLRNKETLSEKEKTEYASLINSGAKEYGLVDYANASAYSVENLTESINSLRSAADSAADSVIKAAKNESDKEWGKRVNGHMKDTLSAIDKSLQDEFEEVRTSESLNNPDLQNIWHFDNEQGKWVVGDYDHNDFMLMSEEAKKVYNSLWENGVAAGYISNDYEDLRTEQQKLLDSIGPTTPPETTEKQYKEAVYNAFLPYIEDALIGKNVYADEIQYLAEYMRDAYIQANISGDENAARTAWQAVFGNSEDPAKIEASYKNVLREYTPKKNAAARYFGVERLGTYDYYIDEKGQVYTAEDLDQLAEDEKTQMQAARREVARAYNNQQYQANYNEAKASANYIIQDRYARELDEYYANERKAVEDFFVDQYTQGSEANLTPFLEYTQTHGGSVNDDFASYKEMLLNYLRKNIFEKKTGSEEVSFEDIYGGIFDWYNQITGTGFNDEKLGIIKDWAYDVVDRTFESEEFRNRQKGEMPELRPLSLSELKATVSDKGLIFSVNALDEEVDKFLEDVQSGAIKVVDDLTQLFEESDEEVRKNRPQITKVENKLANLIADTYSGVSENSWVNKNAAAISADALVYNILSSGNGFDENALNKFMQSISTGAGYTNWQNAINVNPELSRIIMEGASFNTNTGRWEMSNDTTFENLLYALSGMSLSYTPVKRTQEAQANVARFALDSLLSGSMYLSEGLRNNNLQSAWDSLSKKEQKRIGTFENFEQADTSSVLLPDQEEAIKSVIGETLYGRIVRSITSGEALPDELVAYANQQINNRAVGLNGTSSIQNLANMRAIRTNYATGNFDKDIANAIMSQQWSSWAEYSALVNATDQMFEDLGGTKRLTELENEFDKLIKNTEIDIKIEGVKQLEEAGKVAEGTAARLEALAKGGKAAADALSSLNVESYSKGQQRYDLLKGTQEEQYEAARSILGMTEAQFYANADVNYNKAKTYDAAYVRQIEAATWSRLYNEAPSQKQREEIEQAAALEGYTTYQFDRSGETEIGFRFDEQALREAATNPLLYASRQYTEGERAKALQDIISGKLLYEGENKKLYDAAYGSGGIYTQELVRRLAKGEKYENIDANIINGYQNELRQQSGIYAENYDLTTLGGMFAYNQANRAWNNRAAIAANNAYRSLTGTDIQNVAQLGASISENSDDWLKLIESSDELTKKFENMGVKVGEDGLDFSGVKLEGEAFALALADLINSVAQASESFSEISQLLSVGETYTSAYEYFSGRGPDSGYDNLAQLTGNQRFAQAVKNARANQIPEGGYVDSNGRIYDAENKYVGNFSWHQGKYSWDDTQYGYSLMQNAALGVSGSTDLENFERLMSINGYINEGTLGVHRKSDTLGAFAEATQGISGAAEYLAASEALEKIGTNMHALSGMEAGTEQYVNAEKAISKYYGSVEAAIEATETWDKELDAQAIKLQDKYGDATEEVASAYLNLKGSTKQATAQMKTFNQSVSAVMNNQYYRNLWRKGDRGKNTKDAIAGMLGVDSTQLDTLGEDYVNRMLESMEKVDLSQINTDAAAIAESMSKTLTDAMKANPVQLEAAGIDVSSGPVNLNFDQALSDLAGLLGPYEEQFLALLQQFGLEGQVVVSDNGNGGLKTEIIVNKLGGGKKAGGGGGGGGKSKADKLLEAQKHRIEAIQHENNMLEIEAEDYARANNVTAYESTVDRQIEGQEKLRAAYRQNIAEIKQMMSNVKEGSDEWYKLVEALYSAEEAYAKVASAIDDLIKKQIQERQQLYEFETANNTHAKNMLDIWGRRYSRFNNYSSMNHNIDEQVANARAQLATDTAWANDLAAKIQDQYDRGNNDTDTVREWRQTLDQLIERIASSTEEIAELEASRLSVIQQQRTNNLQTPEHVSKMYDINREMMTLDNNYSGLINAFDKEYSNVYEQYRIWANSREQSLGLLATQTFDTAEWYNTRSDLYEADEQLRQLELQMKQIQNDRIAEQLNYFTKRSDYESGNRQHNLNMIQSEQNRYQSRNELTNYGYMLEKEQEVRQQNIDAAEEELVLLNKTKDALEEQGFAGTENYLNVIELIKQREELIRSETATIEENTKKLKENQEAILKTRKDLEDTLDAEFKAREEQRKKELSARVSLENTILETIKDRYRDEWRLIQEDINKKREALAKEKALISERLNARKQAASQEEKYSELEEYQRQLAMIANDPTRSKDAAQLRARIAELQKALSWEEATQEAQASMETIDQEMAALAEEETTGSNQLSEMLADANNFSEEVENIINGSWDSISAYLTENNKAFKNSLEDGQQQMLEGWEQTWKNMMGIVDTYWEEINEILTSPESFLAYMMASRTYNTASDVGRELLVRAWQDMMDRYISANTSSPEAENYQTDTHPWYEGSGEYGDVDTYSGIGVNGTWGTPENGVNMPVDNGQIIFPEPTPTPAPTPSQKPKGNGNGKIDVVENPGGPGNEDEPDAIMFDSGDDAIVRHGYEFTYNGKRYWDEGFPSKEAARIAAARKLEDIGGKSQHETSSYYYYKHGGLVDYTGHAWVDGTPSKPEAFLSASQTETFKKLADAMTKISISGGIWPDGDMFSGGDTNYGDIYVTINQAELKDDADFDEVAKKVGKSFVKEMSRNGFNLTKYNL